MTRLVEGHSIRSEGKLTVMSLAEEAGVKRWVLTYKYTDLQDEFRAMADGVGCEPDVVLRLREQIAEREGVISRLRSEIRDLTNDRNRLERVTNIYAVEVQGATPRTGWGRLAGCSQERRSKELARRKSGRRPQRNPSKRLILETKDNSFSISAL
jgi:isopentenyl diphosphate isomerase/L-lactate dehydrogenase-like FMN-dependent dehydrogenase